MSPIPTFAQPGHQPEEAVEVLRALWSGQSQSRAELEESFGTQRSCKNMQNVGFDGMAGTDGDLRSAWRATLSREGKLNPQAGSVRDLVLGSASSGPQASGAGENSGELPGQQGH